MHKASLAILFLISDIACYLVYSVVHIVLIVTYRSTKKDIIINNKVEVFSLMFFFINI
jgi:hypothetical protein